MSTLQEVRSRQNRLARYSRTRSLIVMTLVTLLGIPLFLSPANNVVQASSHMDAPSVVFDPAANTTDVYAFLTQRDNVKFLSTALAVYPHQEPGIGPNKYNFDDNVMYEIHVATGNDIAAGRATFSYQFQFETSFKNSKTILQSYLGVIQNVDDAAQNLTQRYTVTKVDNRSGARTALGSGTVPPNNQGIATPFYNQNDDGNRLAKDGVDRNQPLDRYTAQTIYNLSDGSRVFAGQREDGFYGDIESIFDLLSLRGGANRFDSQSGFNVHLIALNIPVSTIGGDLQIVGVYATTSRRTKRILRDAQDAKEKGDFVQVGRQGNPLFCEGLVAIEDKDMYNRSKPTQDSMLFRKYAESPELAKLINALVFTPLGIPPALETGRTDLTGIFIPDLIKVDLSTAPARLAGGGSNHPTNPDDAGYSRLGIFGVFVPGENADVLTSRVQGAGFLGMGVQPGGWPNGRRFGDDVVDIAIIALASDLRNPVMPQVPRTGIPAAVLPALTDGMNKNDSVYNKVLPYGGTPHNGRNYRHNPQQPPQSPIIN
ncbi:MAG TPA: DUF4331 domain-containing protein [Blastocatellia bacterium]|nr:DUF4331 domain-containing protein [Blastocatellia bacterium]